MRCQPLSAAMLCLGLATGAAQAQTAPDGLWHGTLSLGGSAASGSTTSRLLTLAADGARATAADKISLYGLVNNGQSKANGVTTKTADMWRLGGRYDFNLTERLFAFGGGDLEGNKLQALDSRYGLNGGVGYKLIRESAMTWDLFAGIGYTHSKFTGGTSAKGAQLVLGEESTHKLGESSSFKQRLFLYPGESSIGHRAAFDATLSTVIVGSWTLNLTGSARYSSKVPAGIRKTETLATVGLGYKY